jgi:hypothetical protein
MTPRLPLDGPHDECRRRERDLARAALALLASGVALLIAWVLA